jgi:hypothetical protein
MQSSCARCGDLRLAILRLRKIRRNHFQGRQVATLVFLTAIASAVLVAGCHRGSTSDSSLPIQTKIGPQPVRVGGSTVTLTGVTDGLGEPLAGVHIQIEGDMAHPGMAPVFAEARETAPGVYVAQINFNMPGDWVLLEHIRLANGRKIERQVDVRGVAGQ